MTVAHKGIAAFQRIGGAAVIRNGAFVVLTIHEFRNWHLSMSAPLLSAVFQHTAIVISAWIIFKSEGVFEMQVDVGGGWQGYSRCHRGS